MKFVNPMGREPGSGIQPRACTCTSGYAGYRGNNDSCLHCGCGCGSAGEYRTGNRVKSVTTIRVQITLKRNASSATAELLFHF